MPGFDFSNYNRNAALHARGVPLPKATSTGTTIVGCIFDNGVVVRSQESTSSISLDVPPFPLDFSLTFISQIAADTRATSGPIVADKVKFAQPVLPPSTVSVYAPVDRTSLFAS